VLLRKYLTRFDRYRSLESESESMIRD